MIDGVIYVGAVRVSISAGVFAWVSGMAIDYDGAPRAYAPEGLVGLDHLANAGKPGNWWGLVCGPDGKPVVQGPDDPAPGCYVSTTALQDRSRRQEDPRRYVDAMVVPYASIPRDFLQLGVKPGDVGIADYRGKSCAFIVGDVGPRGKLGEGSPALHKAIGCWAPDSGVAFRLYAGSAAQPAWPRLLSEISAQVADLEANAAA